MSEKRGKWGSRAGFVLAAAGSAVGLGNVWKFPYITGENGGGLFVLIYLFCILVVGIPIMAAEIMIGRSARKQPVGAFEVLQGGKTSWSVIGWLGVLAGFVILSYYIVVAGWAADYTLKSVVNFTEPIHKVAKQEALKYRAATPLAQMRAMLVAKAAKKSGDRRSAEIRREAPKSVWEAHGSFRTALDKAGGGDGARAALLESPKLRERVAEAERLLKRVDGVKAAETKRATAHYAKVGARQIRDEAETAHRRQVTAKKVGEVFGAVVSDGWTASFWAAIFMLITILVVAGGVSAGIERTCRVLMPALIAVMILMVCYGATQSGFGEALSFVFSPDPTRLKASGVLEALGHAFFTLSLGMGAMLTYGSYQESKEGLFKQSVWIAGLDTGVALLACMMMFPIIFSYDQPAAAGPGLVFKSMPLAFAEIGQGGMLLAILFFALLLVAALTSAISLLEVVASYFIDVRGWSRSRAAWIIGGAILVFGLPSAFSFDPGFAMASWEPTFGRSFFDTMDYLASNWLLPAGGLMIAIYAGWVMPRRLREAELIDSPPTWVSLWLILIRWVAPLLVLLVLLQKVGFIDADELIHSLF